MVVAQTRQLPKLCLPIPQQIEKQKFQPDCTAKCDPVPGILISADLLSKYFQIGRMLEARKA